MGPIGRALNNVVNVNKKAEKFRMVCHIPFPEPIIADDVSKCVISMLKIKERSMAPFSRIPC
jgi:hypothetical protein